MQKKKKIIYIMLPIVVLVWSTVFYQVYTYFVAPPVYASKKVEKKVNIETIQADTFSIVANYRDPFLGKKTKQGRSSYHSNNSGKTALNRQAKKSNRNTSIKTDKKWPLITFNGMIKNNSSNSKVAIITVDGKEFLVKEGVEIAELKILKIEKSVIKVRFQKENKMITK